MIIKSKNRLYHRFQIHDYLSVIFKKNIIEKVVKCKHVKGQDYKITFVENMVLYVHYR